MSTQPEITDLLAELRAGRRDAMDQLVGLVYQELRRIAHRQLSGGRVEATLGTTALVHEAYLKLAAQTHPGWEDRAHFFAVAAIAMRQVLVDEARRRSRSKRGGGYRRISLDENTIAVEDQAEALLELDEALTRLSTLDQRLGRIVDCRFFGGMTEEETAHALEVDPRTVRRGWVKARAFLFDALSP